MNIGLIPPDERPIYTQCVKQIVEAAGSTLQLPPNLCQWHTPADPAMILQWIQDTAPTLDSLIISVEMLGYGGLLASRVTQVVPPEILARLDVLRQIKAKHPSLKMYAFSVVMSARLAATRQLTDNEQDAQNLQGYSSVHHQLMYENNVYTSTKFDRVTEALAPELRRRFNQQRLQNHLVNVGVLGLLDGTLDALGLCSDQMAEYGMDVQERYWLQEWQSRLQPHELAWYGSPESACLGLVTRALYPTLPTVHVAYAISQDTDLIPAEENQPIDQALYAQLEALNCRMKAHATDAALIMAVNPPSPMQQPYNRVMAKDEREHRGKALSAFAQQIAKWIQAGHQVAVADLAYPEGSDPVLIEALRTHCDLKQLAAYSSAGSASTSFALALLQAVSATQHASPEVQRTFLIQRIAEDYLYQRIVRPQLAEITKVSLAEVIQTELVAMHFEGWQVFEANILWDDPTLVNIQLSFGAFTR